MTPQRRSVRLLELRELFERRRAGYTPRDLARLTGVSVRSIQRDLLVLQTESGVPLAEEHGRYFLPAEERLTPMKLNLQEARALLLATRLFLRYSDEGDPYAASATPTAGARHAGCGARAGAGGGGVALAAAARP